MKCIIHPEVDATGTCTKCGKGLCNDCIRWLHGKTYCHPCAYNIPIQKAEPTFPPTDSKDGRAKVSQDKASKLLEASKIFLYLAFVIGVIIPSCSAIILWTMGAEMSSVDFLPKVLVSFLSPGIVLLILAAFCRIIAQVNQRNTERMPKTASVILSEDIIRPTAGLSIPLNQPTTTLGTKIAPAMPSQDITIPSLGLDKLNNLKCVNHPIVAATTICVKCGRGVCNECRQEMTGETYCQSCARELLNQKATSAPLRKERGNGGNIFTLKEDSAPSPLKFILLLLLLNPLLFASFRNKNLDEFSYLSIASVYCASFGYVALFVYIFAEIVVVIAPSNGPYFPDFAFTAMITLYILAVILGMASLYRPPNTYNSTMAYIGMLSGATPLMIAGGIYLTTSNIKSTDIYLYTGILLCISGVIIGILSFFRHLHKRKIKTLLIELLLCIILVIFGAVYLVKS